MKVIAYRGPVSVFRSTVLPALCRAGMVGLKIAGQPYKIQAMVEAALQRDPEYVKSLVKAG